MRYLTIVLFTLSMLTAAGASAQNVVMQEREKLPDLKPGSVPVAIDTISKYLEYPEAAKRAGIEGSVEVSALIGVNGDVLRVMIDKSTNAIFEKPAFTAMQHMRYKPAIDNGERVRVWIKEKIIFKLAD
jgi:TonB family protein